MSPGNKGTVKFFPCGPWYVTEDGQDGWESGAGDRPPPPCNFAPGENKKPAVGFFISWPFFGGLMSQLPLRWPHCPTLQHLTIPSTQNLNIYKCTHHSYEPLNLVSSQHSKQQHKGDREVKQHKWHQTWGGQCDVGGCWKGRSLTAVPPCLVCSREAHTEGGTSHTQKACPDLKT